LSKNIFLNFKKKVKSKIVATLKTGGFNAFSAYLIIPLEEV